MVSSLARRSDAEERMDQPDCDPEALLRTVDQFASINRFFSRSRSLLIRTVLRDMKRVPDRAYHLVDLGAGGCDLPVWLLQHARKAGLTLRVTAVDCDPRIVDHAQRNHAGCEGLEIVCGNALDLPSFGTMDYVFGNHFLHHLTAEEAVTVLRQCTSCTDRGFLFNDLSRSHVSLFAFNLLARLAYRKSFALEDGLQSIRRGFRRNELYAYCEEAGVESPRCGRLVPGRIWLAGGSMCSALTPPKGRGIAGRRQM